MKIISMRRLFFIHRSFGLITGIFLFLVGLSGSLLVYHDEIERVLDPQLYHIPCEDRKISIDSTYNLVYSRYGKEYSSFYLTLPRKEGEILEYMLFGDPVNHYSNKIYIVDIDPYNGKILREGLCSRISTSFMTWVMFFHEGLWTGVIGMTCVTLISISIFISMITGIIIYRKKIKEVIFFRISLKWKNKNMFYRNLHRYIGVWALIFNSLLFFTGFWMLKGILSPDAWKLEKPGRAFRYNASIDRCLSQVSDIALGFEPVYVNFPLNEGGSLTVSGNAKGTSAFLYGYASTITFDSAGRMIEYININKAGLSQKVEAAFWPLHIGSYGGDFIKIIYIIGGLTPGILSLTGFMIWRRRTGITIGRFKDEG
jgi:uncharacterized iron-regulated membrane protein